MFIQERTLAMLAVANQDKLIGAEAKKAVAIACQQEGCQESYVRQGIMETSVL